MADDDNNSDHENVRSHSFDFIRTGVRSSADELSGAALGFARGGLAGGLAGAFLMPLAEGAGHFVARVTGLEKDPDDR